MPRRRPASPRRPLTQHRADLALAPLLFRRSSRPSINTPPRCFAFLLSVRCFLYDCPLFFRFSPSSVSSCSSASLSLRLSGDSSFLLPGASATSASPPSPFPLLLVLCRKGQLGRTSGEVDIQLEGACRFSFFMIGLHSHGPVVSVSRR